MINPELPWLTATHGAGPSSPAPGAGLGEQPRDGLDGDEWLARQLIGFLDLYGRTLKQQGCADADVSDFFDFAMQLDQPPDQGVCCSAGPSRCGSPARRSLCRRCWGIISGEILHGVRW